MKRLIVAVAALFVFMGTVMGQPTSLPLFSTASAPHVVWIGDSITANANSVSPAGTVIGETVNGYPTWAKLLTGGRINTQLNSDDFAVGGFTTGQMLTEVPAAIAAKPDVCVVHGGRNDAQGNPPAMPDTLPGSITFNLRQIYDQLQAAQCVIIAIKILSNNNWNSLQAKQKAFQVNQWIEQQKLTRKGFYAIDMGSLFDDPTNTTAWAPRANYVEDGTHPSTWGAYVIGNQLANLINTLWPTARLRLQNVEDVYNATDNPTGDILTNHMFVGTGGTLGSGASGAVAAGWTLDTLPVSPPAGAPLGATVVGSKTTTADGRQAQTITISGNATGASVAPSTFPRVRFYQGINIANLSQGDTIECSVDANWGATNNVTAVRAIFQSNENSTIFFSSGAATGQVNSNLGYSLPTNAGGPATTLSIPIYTPRRTIGNQPTNVGGQSLFMIEIDFFDPSSATPVAGTFQFASPSCRKIPTVTAGK